MTGDGGPNLRARVERDGHVMLRGAVPEPVVRRAQMAAHAETGRVATEPSLVPEGAPVEYLTAIKLCERSPVLREVVRAGQLARWAAAALGVDRVRLLYDQLFTKPPGATFTMWHQDQVYLPIDTSDVIEAGRVGMIRGWVSLTALPADVGGLHFVDGSHRLGPVDLHGVGMGPPGRRDTATIGGRDLAITDYGSFGAGDATLHAGYTVHGSAANASGAARYAVAVAYVPDGTRVAEPADEQQEMAIALHTPGKKAGDLIDGDVNPLLWPAEAGVMATATEPSPQFPPFPAGVDIELTSRCNASCSFCPRDATPHQGLIDDATFTAALGRAVEYRDAHLELQRKQPGYFGTPNDSMWLSYCGMGEPLLHPRVVEYVSRAAEAGLRPIINSNGALLTPELGEELMDAGLEMACLNVGEIGDEYEAVYRLPFERTRANVEHFLAASRGRCSTTIALVDHRGDPAHAAAMRDYWSALGAESFMPFDLVNRAGALQVDEQVETFAAYRDQAKAMLEEKGGWAQCWVPFLYPIIGYDGNYYLCSSDWRKEVNLGNVFEDALTDVLDEKVEQVCGRSPICQGCTHEPTNALARMLADADASAAAGDSGPTSTPDGLLTGLDYFAGCLAAMRTHMPRSSTDRRTTSRRLIPLRS